jgi:hypothetical protein
MLDRDWTEFCHWCREPLALYESRFDDGRVLDEKNVTVTKRTATLVGIPAFVFFELIPRPQEVEDEIKRLSRRMLEIAAAYPPTRFRARQIWPERGREVVLTPKEWADEGILMVHRAHHATCPEAQGRELPVGWDALMDVRVESRLWSPNGGTLF